MAHGTSPTETPAPALHLRCHDVQPAPAAPAAASAPPAAPVPRSGALGFSLLQAALKAAQVESINAWPAGAVIVALINFLVIAFVVFLIVRAIEAFKRTEKAVAPPDTQAQLASAVTRLADALDRKAL
jgi:large-conductance mechanosensitive channel